MAKRKRKNTPQNRKRNAQQQGDETLVDLVEARDNAQDFMDRNQKTIFGVLTVLVLLVGGWLAYQNFVVAPKEEKAQSMMYQAENLFQQDSFSRALTLPGNGFLDIIENYGGTGAGNLALYYAGVSYLNIGQFDAAISYLEDYDADGDVMPVMKYGALGDAYSEAGDLGKALSLYARAADAEENDVLAPYYLKKAGLLAQKQGQVAEAREYFEQIRDEYPNSVEGRDIDKYIMRAQG